MDENSKRFKKRRHSREETSPESPRKKQRVTDWDPFGKGESRSIPQSVGTSASFESIPRWDPLSTHTPSKQQMTAPQSVSAAMGSLEQGFDAPPIDEQIPVWDPFKDNEEEDDPAQDPFIAKMREDMISRNLRNRLKNLSYDSVSNAFEDNLSNVQKEFDENRKKSARKVLELELRGFYKKGDTYQPLEGMRQKFDVSQRTTLFPKRRRSLDQIRCEAIKVSKRRRPLRRVLHDPLAERRRRLLARSHNTMAQRRQRDPDLYRKQMRRKQKKDIWRGMSHRKVYQRSPYKVFDQNRDAANRHLNAKRNSLARGMTAAVTFSPRLSNFGSANLPTFPQDIYNIPEKDEPTPTGRPYFPEKFDGYPSRMKENILSHRSEDLPTMREMPQLVQSASWPNPWDSSAVTQPHWEGNTDELPEWDMSLSDSELSSLFPGLELISDDSPPPTHYETDDDSELE